MRLLESLLLFADLLTIIVLSVPHHRALPWMRHLAPAGLLIAFAQVLGEGPRWQMAPAYGLTAVLLLISLRSSRAAAGRPAEPGGANRIAVAAGVVAWVVAVALLLAIPVFGFPQPTGPHAIGTLTYAWVDKTRSDIFNANPDVRRELVAQIWYPTQRNLSGPRAAYLPQASAATAAFARIHHLPACLFGHFRYVSTNARLSVPVAAGPLSFPVLIFLEGASGYRPMNTFLVEALAHCPEAILRSRQP